MFTAPFHSNGSHSIVAYVFFAAGICLPSSCLAMEVSSDFTIPPLGIHVTIFYFGLVRYLFVLFLTRITLIRITEIQKKKDKRTCRYITEDRTQ
jgi:hypothetical protein